MLGFVAGWLIGRVLLAGDRRRFRIFGRSIGDYIRCMLVVVAFLLVGLWVVVLLGW